MNKDRKTFRINNTERKEQSQTKYVCSIPGCNWKSNGDKPYYMVLGEFSTHVNAIHGSLPYGVARLTRTTS